MKIIYIILFICPFLIYPQKKQLQVIDYKKWQKLEVGDIDPKGQSFSYYLFNDEGPDTLVVRGFLKGADDKYYINAYDFKFLNDDKVIYRDSKGNIRLESNKGKLLKIFKGIDHFELSLDKRFIFLYSGNFSLLHPGKFSIFDCAKLQEKEFLRVIDSSLTSDNSIIAISLLNDEYGELVIYSLKNGLELARRKIGNYGVENLHWAENNNSIVFILTTLVSKGLEVSIMGYLKDFKNDEVQYITDFARGTTIATSFRKFPYFSKDLKKIFFKTANPPDSELEDNVEVWNSLDAYLFPAKKYFPPYSRSIHTKIFYVDSKKIQSIDSNFISRVTISPNDNFAIIKDKIKYLPEYANGGTYCDVYLFDFQKCESTLFLQRYPEGQLNDLQFSPSGDYFLFLKEKNWWVFDYKSKKSTNLTHGINAQFTKVPYFKFDISSKRPAWSADEKYILIGGQKNYWIFKSDGTKPTNISAGAEISLDLPISLYKLKGDHFGNIINPYNGIFFEAVNRKTDERGFFKWNLENGLIPIVYKSKRISNLIPVSKKSGYIFIQENFDLPPEIVFKKNSSTKEFVLGRSNKHHDNYSWGKSEMISYNSDSGEPLRSALLYPAQYKEGEKYPLICFIYMDKSRNVHKYYNPSMYSDDFNPTLFTSRGYFVLMPQIKYDVSNPGLSAHQCLEAALNNLEKKQAIDMDHIGLYGHSFGGYESSFIATQSNRFATIVAGAPWTDLVSSYFSFVPFMQQPDFMRIEYQQHQMGTSFFKSKEHYLANSPVFNADKIETPMLIWVGKNDPNISWFQGKELFLALTRQQKNATLLVYPRGGHNLLLKEDRFDLNTRLIQWFDYYLKGKMKPKWIQ